jgi:CheY-like chemotaxis protein
MVFLAVEDDGCGMDHETLGRAFEPFFTTKGPDLGTGLGLATVCALTREFGGDIVVTSEVGHGSRVEVHFPQVSSESATELSADVEDTPIGRGELVLLVEDHEMARRALERILTRHGYRVKVAGDGVEALAMLEQHQDVAVVVSDITMPRMGGDELHQLMRRRDLRVPILFLSGYPAAPDRPGRPAAALDAPILVKPVATNELLRLIRHALDKARQASPAA